jgi:DNA-binding NarL/FixJ family response regulator
VVEAGSASEALAQLQAHTDVDLVLLDLNLPDANGLDLLTDIGNRSPDVPVVMLSGTVDQQRIRDALDRGASGFILKAESREVLLKALALVLAGGVYVPPAALSRGQDGGGEGAPTPQSLGLTERQMEVLALLMQGMNNKLICRALGLAEPTVKNHVSAILRALDVNSRTEAVLAVARMNWVLPGVGRSR